MIVEGRRGNVQSEPEFGALLDAFRSLEGKGFGVGEISTALGNTRGKQDEIWQKHEKSDP